MGRRQDVQSAEGDALDYRGYGVYFHFDKNAPTNGAKGYGAGGLWVQPSTGLIWTNVGTFASATWIETDPTAAQSFLFGGSLSAIMSSAGTLYKSMGSGTAPGSTGSDICVDFYTLPAGSLAKAGQNVTITAGGSITGTDSSTVQIQTTATLPVIGSILTSPTPIATTGAMSLSGADGWLLQSQVWKYGAAGSNTQAFQELATVAFNTHGGVGAPGTLTYTEASPIYVAITINVTTTASHCKLWWWDVAGQN